MGFAILGVIVGVMWLVLLWLSIIVWVYRDIRDRTRDLGLQVLAVFVVMMFFPGLNIPGLALYLMMRPRETLEEAYSRSLEEEALLREIGDEGVCPSCRRFVERAWRACPYCRTPLKDVCVKCSELLSFSWVTCPYCGTDRKGAATVTAISDKPSETTEEPESDGAQEAATTPRRRTAAKSQQEEVAP